MRVSFCPSRRELLAGGIYLILQATLVPVLVALLVVALPMVISDSLTNLMVFFINFLATVLIFRKFLLRSLLDFFAAPVRQLGFVLAGLGVYYLASFAGALILQLLGLVTPNVNDGTIQDMLQEDMLPIAICIIALAPLTEELLYRSLLLAPLYGRSKLGAYALSVAIFSLAHVVGYIGTYDLQTLWICFLQYIPASLSLAWIYAKSQNVFTSMLVHTAVNSLGFLLLR